MKYFFLHSAGLFGAAPFKNILKKRVDFSLWISCTILRILEHCMHKTTNFMNNEYHTHRILFSHDRVLYSSSFLILPCLVVYIFLFLDQKVTSFCEKNPKRANPFWSFVCTYSPLILLLGISHCSMPIFGTPPSTQLGKRGQRFAHWLPQKMCKKPHPNLNQTLNTAQQTVLWIPDQPDLVDI